MSNFILRNGSLVEMTFKKILKDGELVSIGGSESTILDAPSNFSATGFSDRISLSWTAPQGATGYTLFRNTTNDVITATQVSGYGGSATSHADYGVSSGITYYYFLRADNGVLLSQWVSASAQINTSSSLIPSSPTLHSNSVVFNDSGISYTTLTSSGITVSTGQTISGQNYYFGSTVIKSGFSTVTVPLIDIKTSQQVIIENCILTSASGMIHCDFAGANVIIRNCIFIGLEPSLDDRWKGDSVWGRYASSIVIENCYWQQARGVKFEEMNGGSFTFRFNKFKNIDGRFRNETVIPSDQSGCIGPARICSNMVALKNLTGTSILIEWNELLSYPEVSSTEDMINFYNVACTVNNRAMIRKNFLYGLWPFPDAENNTHITGRPFTTDGAGDVGYIDLTENYVVVPTALNIVAGHNVRIYNNRKVSSEKFPSGASYLPYKQSINIYDYYNTSQMYQNEINDNYINHLVTRTPTIQTPSIGTASGNTVDSGATLASEETEYQSWLSDLAANNITIGTTS